MPPIRIESVTMRTARFADLQMLRGRARECRVAVSPIALGAADQAAARRAVPGTGITSAKVEPSMWRLQTAMWPPSNRASAREMLSPRPVPPYRAVAP